MEARNRLLEKKAQELSWMGILIVTAMIRSERFRRLFKEGLWIVLGQVMVVLGSLLGVRVLTELLTPAAYGELALGMTLATLINQTLLGPLSGGLTRFYSPAVEQGDFPGYWSAACKMNFYATGVIVLISALAVLALSVSGLNGWLGITTAAFVFAILSGNNASLSGIQSAARQLAVVAMHQGADPLLRLVIAACLITWLGASSSVAMYGYVIASALLLGSQYYFFRKIVVKRANTSSKERNWQDEIWNFSWPIGIFGIFTWMQLVSDRWALQYFSSTGEVGKYAALYQLGYYPVALITGMAMQFLVPILYQRSGDANDSKRNANVNKLSWQLTWVTLGLTSGVFLGAFLLHVQIFRILVAKEYGSVSYLLPWMILGGGVFASGQALASNLQAQMKTREMIVAKITTAIVGMTLNFAGAYWYGIAGIVSAGVLFSMMYFAWMAVLVNKGSETKCLC
jgi:O-antigen/teichoic acid export membrane protein